MQSVFFFLLTVLFLSLYNDEYEFRVGCDEYFVFGGFEANEFEVIGGVEVANGVFGLGDELRKKSCEGVAYRSQ